MIISLSSFISMQIMSSDTLTLCPIVWVYLTWVRTFLNKI